MFETKDIPRWAWFWLAFSPVVLQVLGRFLIPEFSTYNTIFNDEAGIIEVLTVILLIPAMVLAIICARRFWSSGFLVSACLLYIYALGCLYIFGEELSYGQHIFGWETPEYFLENNKQGETNLHNLYGSNRGLHKMLLIIGIGIGGIIAPVWSKLKGKKYYPAQHWIIWLIPTSVCLPVSVFLVFSHFTVKIIKWTGMSTDYQKLGFEIPEVIELYISFFLLIYISSLYARLRQSPHLNSKKLTIGP